MRRKKINTDTAKRTRKLFRDWQAGRDVKDELSAILSDKPDWRENPPPSIGRNAYIMWDEFLGACDA